MKSLVIAAIAALTFGTVASAQVSEVRTSGPQTICAEKARFGWKLSGDAGSTFRDWATNKAIGEAIGDGNCQTGWTMVSSVDQRAFEQLGMGDVSSRGFNQTTVTGVTVETSDAGRITAPYQGFAPVVLKGRPNHAGDKWKLVEADGNGGGIYKVKRSGNTSRPRGTELHFTQQMLIDRDNQGGTGATNEYWWRNFRYNASRDTTTTDYAHVTGVTVRTVRYSCPSQWSYAHVSPTGEMFVYTQEAKPCQRKVTTRNVDVVRTDFSRSVRGSKYVTPQN